MKVTDASTAKPLIRSAKAREEERAQRKLLRQRETDMLNLWDAEINVLWMTHDKESQKVRDDLKHAIGDLAWMSKGGWHCKPWQSRLEVPPSRDWTLALQSQPRRFHSLMYDACYGVKVFYSQRYSNMWNSHMS